MMSKARARDLGLDFPGAPGPLNAITDVGGVAVGFSTIVRGRGKLVPGRGPVRTGVTAVLPRGQDSTAAVWAGFYSLNGNGEMTGTHWIADAGHFGGPVVITNTHSVGMAHHATVKWLIEHQAGLGADAHMWSLPVIAETYDGVLNDVNGLHVEEAHVFEAIDSARSGPVAEGNVGGGTGMICYDFKGGTGTASRLVRLGTERYTVGALVQANHGRREWLTILGVPVGRHLTADTLMDREQGSIIVVLGTDIPMLPHQLTRVAKRAAIGIGRHGTPGGNSSGDIFLAFSVANPPPPPPGAPLSLTLRCINDEHFDSIYLGAVEAVEEAVVNALVAAEDMTTLKPPGAVCRAIDHRALVEVMRAYHRCEQA